MVCGETHGDDEGVSRYPSLVVPCREDRDTYGDDDELIPCFRRHHALYEEDDGVLYRQDRQFSQPFQNRVAYDEIHGGDEGYRDRVVLWSEGRDAYGGDGKLVPRASHSFQCLETRVWIRLLLILKLVVVVEFRTAEKIYS